MLLQTVDGRGGGRGDGSSGSGSTASPSAAAAAVRWYGVATEHFAKGDFASALVAAERSVEANPALLPAFATAVYLRTRVCAWATYVEGNTNP